MILFVRWGSAFVAAATLVTGSDQTRDAVASSDPIARVPAVTEKLYGTERLGWDQRAASSQDLAAFRYLVYVDNIATEMENVSCSATSGADGYHCTGRLPRMSAGEPHLLSMSAYITNGSTRTESPRSVSIPVVLLTTSAAAAVAVDASTFVTTDGVHLRSRLVADNLVDPTDLAAAPDGRIYIAERAGRIQVFRDGALRSSAATSLPDVISENGQGLLALAVDPDYAANHRLYAVYNAENGFRVIRLRAVQDTLGDRTILIDGVSSSVSHPAAALRFGPDGKLYVGFDDAGEPLRAADLGSFNGKILRLNPDGTAPRDRQGVVYAAGVSAPAGLAWNANGTRIWIADRISEGVLSVRGAQDPTVEQSMRYRLPDGSNVSALTVYHADLIRQFQGNLLISAGAAKTMVRLRLDPANPVRIIASEGLFGDQDHRVKALTVASDGSIYTATERALFHLTLN